jgi:hypothetical protein
MEMLQYTVDLILAGCKEHSIPPVSVNQKNKNLAELEFFLTGVMKPVEKVTKKTYADFVGVTIPELDNLLLDILSGKKQLANFVVDSKGQLGKFNPKSMKVLNKNHFNSFGQFLAGLWDTDGSCLFKARVGNQDGTQKSVPKDLDLGQDKPKRIKGTTGMQWQMRFTQANYNLDLLHYLKNSIGYGNVTPEGKETRGTSAYQ